MYVMTKEQAQEWLNRPEQEGIRVITCYGKDDCAELDYEDGTTVTAWFAVETEDNIYRKTPWHWPEPDENTPIDAKVWVRNGKFGTWLKAHNAGVGKVFFDLRSSWSAESTCNPYQIVLANPDDLDEVPPVDLEV